MPDKKLEKKLATQILDLTDSKTLFDLAIESSELIGRKGTKLLNDLKERASEADYTHVYFRDSLRPGVIWFNSLLDERTIPTRGKINECRETTENVFKGFLNSIPKDDQAAVLSATPPITNGVSALDLVTALEYIIFVHPEMVRAWASLIFAYGEILKIPEAAENAYAECIGTCSHAQVVQFLLGSKLNSNS